MVHYKCVNEDIHEFYRCCFVPIEKGILHPKTDDPDLGKT
jgi:hypothetical protein